MSKTSRRRPSPDGPRRIVLLLLLVTAAVSLARAEDGYELWLRYRPAAPALVESYRSALTAIVAPDDSATQVAARDELERGLLGLLGAAPARAPTPDRRAAVVLGTPDSQPLFADLASEFADLGDEGYVLRRTRLAGRDVVLVGARRDTGVLYGVFHLLRLMQTGRSLDALDVRERPRVALRLLNHWDNLDRTVERGYSGSSIWDWHLLPDWVDPRYTDYARANASIGINGTVLNNVNTDAASLTRPYLEKAAAVADALRPWGIRIFLSARFSAPIEIGGLPTADPLDPAVRRWWREKADEIYERVPDFGGFLVKANSEGQPGPQDYGRSHAEGANLLADAVAPHGGVVMWRAFVYSHEQPDDRAKQAYSEFVPLDGRFRDNVVLQVKNGPIDFQPREPFHPLFGAMPRTPLMLELQVTKEYLGFATHLAYLGTLFEEVLRSDTRVAGAGSTVARVVDGSLQGQRLTGMAGVANVGTDRTWSGSHFDQANWFALGRLAWNPSSSARDVAEEWVRMTFSNEPALVDPVVGMMMGSREAVVDYMTPLGLHHLMDRGHHYGPGPWIDGGPRADWTSVYYHRATAQGIGFDRTARGSDAVSQYAPEVARRFGDVDQVPEELLLWFHHLPWDHRTRSGRPLWDELVVRYDRGVDAVRAMRESWARLEPHVDAARFRQVAAFLAIQEKEAQWWRDASIAYFSTFSRRPLPQGHAPPPHPLAYYQSLRFPHAPGHW